MMDTYDLTIDYIHETGEQLLDFLDDIADEQEAPPCPT